MRDDNYQMKQQQKEQQQAEMIVCMYCGKEKGSKFICCGEVHFEEVENECV